VEKYIEIIDAVKTFGTIEALRGISITVRKGEVVLIIGPSGSGKSTLLRCINRLERLDSGEILIDGESVTDPDADIRHIREKVGMVFQSFNLFPHLTVLDNITLAPINVLKKSKEEAVDMARALLEKVGLLDKEKAGPEQLSGGQQQRVAIARALAMTMLVVSHEMGFARAAANRIIFMDAGQIVEEAPPDTFFTSPREERTRRFLEHIL